MPHTAKPAPTAVAVPVLLDPGFQVVSIAFRVGPAHELLASEGPDENSGMFTLPMMMAPASISVCTTCSAVQRC
jgi:hypothetical protein